MLIGQQLFLNTALSLPTPHAKSYYTVPASPPSRPNGRPRTTNRPCHPIPAYRRRSYLKEGARFWKYLYSFKEFMSTNFQVSSTLIGCSVSAGTPPPPEAEEGATEASIMVARIRCHAGI